FGGTSHIRWGETAGNDFQAELCASKQALFPKPTTGSWPGTPGTVYPDGTQANTQSLADGGPTVNNLDWVNGRGSPMGIGIYGLSEDNAPRPRTVSTDPTDGADLTFSAAYAPTYDAADSSSNPVWKNNAGTGPPTWDDVKSVDSSQASATWAGGSNNPAELAFKMPDLTTMGIPLRSEI